MGGGQHRSAVKARHRGSAGVREHGKGTMGFSGNLGEPTSSLGKPKVSPPNPTKEGRGEKIGSRSSFIVPEQSRRTETAGAWE